MFLHSPSVDVSLTCYESCCRPYRYRRAEHHGGTALLSRRPGPLPRSGRRGPEAVDGARIVSLHFGDVDVELLEPNDPASPVAKFLAKRGPGIHHVCYRVPDLDAALARCRAAGYQLVDEK